MFLGEGNYRQNLSARTVCVGMLMKFKA